MHPEGCGAQQRVGERGCLDREIAAGLVVARGENAGADRQSAAADSDASPHPGAQKGMNIRSVFECLRKDRYSIRPPDAVAIRLGFAQPPVGGGGQVDPL